MPRIGQYEIVIDDDPVNGVRETVRPIGWHTGKMHYLDSGGGILAVKIDGHHVFSGTGRPQIYAPGRYVIFKIVGNEAVEGSNHKRLLVCEKFMEWNLKGHPLWLKTN